MPILVFLLGWPGSGLIDDLVEEAGRHLLDPVILIFLAIVIVCSRWSHRSWLLFLLLRVEPILRNSSFIAARSAARFRDVCTLGRDLLLRLLRLGSGGVYLLFRMRATFCLRCLLLSQSRHWVTRLDPFGAKWARQLGALRRRVLLLCDGGSWRDEVGGGSHVGNLSLPVRPCQVCVGRARLLRFGARALLGRASGQFCLLVAAHFLISKLMLVGVLFHSF